MKSDLQIGPGNPKFEQHLTFRVSSVYRTRCDPKHLPKNSNIQERAEVKREENDSTSVDPVKKDRDPVNPRSRGGTPAASRGNQTPKANEVDEPANEVSTIREQGQEQSPVKSNSISSPLKLSPLKPAKRRRDRAHTSKVASRRRSTLSPWELDTLIQGSGAGVNCA